MVPNPTFKRLSDKDSQIFVVATLNEMADKKGEKPDDEIKKAVEESFLIQILDKRIEVFKLPIQFTTSAKMAILAYVDRPGSVVALLIDCLTAYEGKTVNLGMLVELYPDGFYDEETMMRYIDEYLKPRKVKWAELY